MKNIKKEIINPVVIDTEKCIGCGLCEKDCPNSCIHLKDNKAYMNNVLCIECGHCFAICPVNAVNMTNYNIENEPAVSMTEINSDKLLASMKSRRTIRRFTVQPVEENKLKKILEAGRYSPTGANAQNVTFTVLGSKQDKAEKICVKLFREGKKMGKPFINFLKSIEITDDFFFKGAPVVIVVSSSSDINAGLASAYMELMANSLGLGVLYSGFFVVCTKISGKLKKLLQLPKGHKVVSCLVIGYTDIKYQRIVPRKPLQVNIL